MTISIRRSLLFGFAGVLFASIAGGASAADFKFGDTKLSIDTTMSVGTGIRTSAQNCERINTANGGCTSALGVNPNINTDDGDINFARGDFYAATTKIVSDIELEYQNFGAFARLKTYYDYVGNQRAGEEGGSSRFPLRPLEDRLRGDDAHNAAGRGLNLLDAFVYGNFNVGDLPLNVRLGKQVVNWGEGLAIQGAINQFLSVDLGALRTPGAEIKEALLPQEMLYLSLGLPANFNVEGWYGLKFRHIELDPVSTFFSGVDILGPGGAYLNLTTDGASAATDGQRLYLDEGRPARDYGQYGLKLGYYADWLNEGTELGLYYVNYHSPFPFVEYQNALPTGFGGTFIPHYRDVYPENLKLIGASFATNLPWLLNGTAFSGEVLYQPNLPMALSSSETLALRYMSMLGFPGTTTIPYDNTPGGYGTSFVKTDAIHGQISTVSTLSTSEPVTRALGADLVVFVANWGFQYMPNVSQVDLNAMAVSRSETQSNNPAYFHVAPFFTTAQPSLHPDTFSHGYRLIASVQYNNAFGTPWTVTPSIQWGQDFMTSAGPVGPGFLDGKKAVTLGVRGTLTKTWNLGVAWTATRGNHFQNMMDDKDFATFDVSYAF